MRARVMALVIVGSLAAAGGARTGAAQSDGTITFVNHGEDGTQTHTMVQYSRGKKLRLDSGEPAQPSKGAFIIDGASGTVTILMFEKKQYMQFTPQDAAKLGDGFKSLTDSLKKNAGATTPTPPSNQSHLNVTQTGTETVAGVTCTVYHITGTYGSGKPADGEVCAAQGVGLFMMNALFGTGSAFGALTSRMGADPKTQSQYAAFKEVLGDGKGIIKASKIENGKKTVVFEATTVDRATPPESIFDIPAGFTKLQMPNFGAFARPT